MTGRVACDLLAPEFDLGLAGGESVHLVAAFGMFRVLRADDEIVL